jgi:hypothetical protein
MGEATTPPKTGFGAKNGRSRNTAKTGFAAEMREASTPPEACFSPHIYAIIVRQNTLRLGVHAVGLASWA